MSELFVVAVAASIGIATMPDVPWTPLWVFAIVSAIAAPFLLFPISRLCWLTFDMILRPRT